MIKKLTDCIRIVVLLGVCGFIISGQRKALDNPLRLTFDLPDKNICLGDSVTLSAKITNVSGKTVILDVNRIADTFIFYRVVERGKTDELSSFATQHGLPTHYTPRFQRLRSKQSYSGEVELHLRDPPFASLGKYRLKVGYSQRLDGTFDDYQVWKGTVWSPEIFVFVNDCDKQ